MFILTAGPAAFNLLNANVDVGLAWTRGAGLITQFALC